MAYAESQLRQITQVLDEQNVEAPTGTFGADSENTFQYVLKYRGRYEEEKDYENLVVRSLPNGEILRLKDIARIELGSMSYTYIGEVNGLPGANCMIAQTSGSNANEIIKQIEFPLIMPQLMLWTILPQH